MKSNWFLILGLLFCVSCSKKVSEQIVAPEPPVLVEAPVEVASVPLPPQASVDAPIILTSIRRSGCFGTCPVYEAKIFSNGRAIYEGKRNVAKLGLFEAMVPAELMDQLKRTLVETGYFGFEKSYPRDAKTMISDLPTVYTSASDGVRKNAVRNNHLAPEELHRFEDAVDQMLDQLMWTRIEN